jgi:acetaldehyde dehydrogenase
MNVAILGTGNIGCDLLVKVSKSKLLNCILFTGRRKNSEGLGFAQVYGVNGSHLGVDAFKSVHEIDIIFDATSAESHLKNLNALLKTGALIIDLTPGKTGRFCVPDVNLQDAKAAMNVNMVTCGGQAAVPIAQSICHCLKKEPSYIETVSTISSLSAGPGTRNSLDEYIFTTQQALTQFTGVKVTKAMINLNPASPPINMSTTIMVKTDQTEISDVEKSVKDCVERLKGYIPGMHFKVPPIYDYRRECILTTIGVYGSGDYLAAYAGNLDIINCAAIKVAENYAQS